MSKTNFGNYFEDFYIDQTIIHPLPRTITDGDVSLYLAFTGSRFALNSSDIVAQEMGYEKRPIDDFLMFHLTFAKSVQDISLNAIANLGYAEVSFANPVYVGDTVSMTSTIIGLRENSNGKSGIVYVHSIGINQKGKEVLNFKRWVMIEKKDKSKLTTRTEIPIFCESTDIKEHINLPIIKQVDVTKTGGKYFFEDYKKGERINHPEGITCDDSDHTLATKLYQNNAKVHFNAHKMKDTLMGQRLIYGGVIISLARAISFNGLENAQNIYAINAGVHANPSFAKDTIYAYTEVLDVINHKREDIGLLRLRTVAIKNQEPYEIKNPKNEQGKYLEHIVLDLDYTVVIPKRITKK